MKKITIFIVSLLFCVIGISVNAYANTVKITESKTFKVDDLYGGINEKMIAVKKYGKWGFMNLTGKMVIQPQFQEAHHFSEGLAAVKIKGKWGYINNKGKIVIKAEYDEDEFDIGGYPFVNGYTEVIKNGKWGNIDKKGKIVITIIYEESNPYRDERILIQQNGKYGFINIKNEMVIKPQFTYANSFSEGVAAVEKNNKAAFIDKTGKLIIPYKYILTSDFVDGVAVVENKDFKMGAINKSGKIVVPFRDLFMYSPPQNGLIPYLDYNAKDNHFAGFISVKTGKKAFNIIPSDHLPRPFKEGLAFISPLGKEYFNNVYTSSGTKINLKNKYYGISPFNNGYAVGLVNQKDMQFKILHKVITK